MANYTIELRQIENCLCYLFPKNFPFYTDSEEMRKNFIQKFYDEYMFREIGFETTERFKRSLLGKLNLIMPYYEQLYKTELESKNINFLLNKDLKETFEREITGSNEVNSNATTNTTTNETNNTTNNATNTSTNSSTTNASTNASGTSSASNNEMMYDTPNTRIDDITKYPTQGSQGQNSAETTSSATSNNTSEGTSSTTLNETSEGTSNQTSNATTTNRQTGENTQTERTSLLSQGNIGITSSAQLLKEWRDVIINIDRMILDDLEDLFLLLY